MKKTLSVLLSAAVLLPSSPLCAAQFELARSAVARPSAAAPGLALPSFQLGLPNVSLPPSLNTGPALPSLPAAASAMVPLAGAVAPQATGAAATQASAPVAAQAQLEHARALLTPASGASSAKSDGGPSAVESREASERVWSGAGETHNAVDTASAGTGVSHSSSLTPSRGAKAAALFGAAAIPLPAAASGAAPAALHWALPLWHAAQPYAIGGAVLASTWVLNKAVRFVVDRLARRGRWDPNTTDTVRFASTIAAYTLGAAVGLHLAGASVTALITGFGVALSLAVKKTVGNLLQGVVFLVNRPFVIGEKMRIGDTMYQVEDMQLQYVTMRVLGKLSVDRPDPVPAGFKLVSFKELDPLGRDADDKGYRFALVRQVSPGPAPRTGVDQIAKQKYSNLAAASITLYRPFTHGAHPGGLGAAFAKVRKPVLPVGHVLSALKATPRHALLKAALWMAGSLALIPLLPVLKTWLAFKAVALLFPYVHGLASLIATRQVARFLDRFIPILGQKLGWSKQAIIVTKLLSQVGVYFIGLSAGMRATGLEWRSVATSLGATAAAISFASSDLLGNLASALTLRFDRPFNIGDTLRVGTDVGIVQEMNMFYVVLKVADGSHTLVPYSVIDATELDSFEPSEARQNPK